MFSPPISTISYLFLFNFFHKYILIMFFPAPTPSRSSPPLYILCVLSLFLCPQTNQPTNQKSKQKTVSPKIHKSNKKCIHTHRGAKGGREGGR